VASEMSIFSKGSILESEDGPELLCNHNIGKGQLMLMLNPTYARSMTTKGQIRN
jgi:hypothetical protein